MSYSNKPAMAAALLSWGLTLRRVDESELGPELTMQPIEKPKPEYPETRQQRRQRERNDRKAK